MKTFKSADSSVEFQQYAQDLYTSDSFQEAFDTFEQRAHHLGFESVLYTYIPKVVLENNFFVEPVFKVSENYIPEFLNHYSDARFDRSDPLIRAVNAGIDQPIEWWGDICKTFTLGESASHEVIDTTKQYGVKSGVTLPLLSGKQGLAGASFINTESGQPQGIANPNLDKLILSTRLFHSMVQSNAGHRGTFAKKVLDTMSETEKQFLAGLARGQSPSEIAYEIGTTDGYLEQCMLKIRRKLSGVNSTLGRPKINKNQLLYYAGLMDIVEHDNHHKQQ